MRVPYLQGGGDEMFDMMRDSGTFESVLPVQLYKVLSDAVLHAGRVRL